MIFLVWFAGLIALVYCNSKYEIMEHDWDSVLPLVIIFYAAWPIALPIVLANYFGKKRKKVK